jgi:HlyD family secretion protein
MSNDLNSIALNKLLQTQTERAEDSLAGEDDVRVIDGGAARYRVVFDGLVQVDLSEETVKANLARLYGCDLSRIEPLFTGKPKTLKRGLSEREADRYVRALNKAGAVARKETLGAVVTQSSSSVPAASRASQFPVVAELKRFSLKNVKRSWVLLGVLAVVVFSAVQFGSGNAAGGSYLTDKIGLGSLSVGVSASGAIKPTREVEVGSELSGTLASVLVRENDRVTKGQLLAELDTSQLQDAVIKSQATVAASEANIAHMEATVAQSRSNLTRMRKLFEASGGKVPSRTELESAEAGLKRAAAQMQSALAELAQAEAILKTDQTNIRKASIVSPVDGVVLSRKVEPGQTVVAAMTIPVLFNIAEDLTQMELHVNVDEADVAHVEVGQKAAFTVAAWNGRKFPAKVERVDLGSTLTDNVVTYTAVLSVQNNDLALRPGMTASAEIITTQRDNVLLVPNAALRFNPEESAQKGGLFSQQDTSRKRLEHGSKTQVWVMGPKQQMRAIPVQLGASNGTRTEVLPGELKPGMNVITEYQEARK